MRLEFGDDGGVGGGGEAEGGLSVGESEGIAAGESSEEEGEGRVESCLLMTLLHLFILASVIERCISSSTGKATSNNQ